MSPTQTGVHLGGYPSQLPDAKVRFSVPDGTIPALCPCSGHTHYTTLALGNEHYEKLSTTDSLGGDRNPQLPDP